MTHPVPKVELSGGRFPVLRFQLLASNRLIDKMHKIHSLNCFPAAWKPDMLDRTRSDVSEENYVPKTGADGFRE